MKVEYKLVSPTKNYTVLVTSEVPKELRMKVNDAIMAKEPIAEQLGFITIDGDNAVLEMAGGEFCGNACRSTAFVTGMNTIICSGIEVKARGAAIYLQNGVQNIYHKVFPLSALEKNGRKFYEAVIKQSTKPTGFMFYDPNTNEIVPLVYIPKSKTLFWENSCASGCAYIAYLMSNISAQAAEISFKNPGGILKLVYNPQSKLIKIDGDIELIKTDSIEI